jgi:2-methylcitrate dehydratase PrpD
MSSVADFLASRVVALEWGDLPPLAIETAKLGVLDTIGVTYAGADETSTQSLISALTEAGGGQLTPGRVTVFSHHAKTTALDAALLNGTAAHALDFDDCNNTMGGHPSAPIVPAIWALAEERGLSGRDLLLAYIAGVEVETKVGMAVNFHHYEKGWHPTATLGTVGAAAACGKLLQLTHTQVTHAIALSTSMASGIKANFGTPTKPFHVGQSARQGLFAALLAKSGLEANPDAFEHRQGFGPVFNGVGLFDWSKVEQHWAAPWDLVEPGLAFKQHPCCASTHPAIDALMMLMSEHNLQAKDIQKIVSYTHPRRLAHTNRPNPTTGLDGKFSVQYVLARAALAGLVSVHDFTDQAVVDDETRQLMERIIALPDPKADMSSYEHFYAHVEVVTTSGKSLSKSIDRPIGRDRDHPLPEGALERKFMSCTQGHLTPAVQDHLLQQILTLDQVTDLSKLMNELISTEA